jgi:hypothetical protein
MNWEDEPYIKLYTRDTVSYKLLPWQGRCLLPLIMRKLDRAGVMDIGKYPPSEAVSVMVDVPIDVTKVGIEALLQAGILEVGNGALLCPNFLEAQEARQSNKARQTAFRQRHRDLARAENRNKTLQNVTKRYETVTKNNAASRKITNRIEENRIEENRDDVVKLSQDCKGSDVGNDTTPTPPPEVLDWKTVPITWQGVHMCLQDLTGFMGDAHYHKRHLQSVADSCNAQADPVAALTKVVKCKQKEVDKNGKRLQPVWLATDFDRLLNTEVKLEKDEEYIRLQRIYFGAEDEWKLQKSIGTKKSVARAEQQYQEARAEYFDYKKATDGTHTHTN